LESRRNSRLQVDAIEAAWGETMKETYRIPGPLEINCNGNHFDSSHSEQLLNVLGFCNSEISVVRGAGEQETQALDSIKIVDSPFDDCDHEDDAHALFAMWEGHSLAVEPIGIE
jgi:hypothetical protein